MERTVAEAVERVFLRGTWAHPDQIGSVFIGTEGDEIAGAASWALDAMADAARHRYDGMHVAGQRECWGERDYRKSDEIGAGRDELTGLTNKNMRAGVCLTLASSQLDAENPVCL